MEERDTKTDFLNGHLGVDNRKYKDMFRFNGGHYQLPGIRGAIRCGYCYQLIGWKIQLLQSCLIWNGHGKLLDDERKCFGATGDRT